jgi:hypothetical protein
MSSNTTSLAHLTNVVQARDKKLGLNLSAKQAVAVPNNLRSEYIIIPSVSLAQFGSYFIFDVKERNTIVSDIIIGFNVNAISGLTGTNAGFPHFVPATFWIQKCELVMNNVTIDTLYPIQEFISQQFLFSDEDRVLINNMQGSYASTTQRNSLATATSNYYIKLRSLFNECHLPLLSDSHNLQIRVYMEQLSNIVMTTGLTGTASSSINSANVILKLMKLPAEIATNRYNAMIKSPEHSIFHNVRYSPFNVNSGVSQTTLVLTPFVGNIICLFFVVRNTNALTGNGAFAFTAIKDFAILDSTSANCVGGQPIPSALALQYLNSFNCKSSYSAETSIGANLAGTVTNTNANVYCWSFSSNLSEALQHGLLLGHRKFLGNEQLQISFTGSLGANVQIDVFAYCQSTLEQGANYVKVYAL